MVKERKKYKEIEGEVMIEWENIISKKGQVKEL